MSRLKPFMYLAGLGFILTFMVHVSSLLSLPFPIGAYTILILFLGIFLFIPLLVALYVAYKLSKDFKEKDRWKAALRGCPSWQKYLLNLFWGYALFTFFLFWIMGGDQGGAGAHGLSVSGVKMFSAGFMAFYVVSMALLYSAIHVRTDVQARRCPNGHLVSPLAKFCRECGSKVIDGEVPK